VELGGYSTLVGFFISFVFLFTKLSIEGLYSRRKIFFGSLIGAGLIAMTIILTLISVVGLSVLAGVSLTGFSNMSFVLSVGFAVEYSVHIIARWLRANSSYSTSLSRVQFTMSFLMLPTFMSFVSSTIGVVCLAFTEFNFNQTFFFKPLIIVMFTSYFFGCWWLPAFLTYLDFDIVKMGKSAGIESEYLSTSTSPALRAAGKELDDDDEGQSTPVDEEPRKEHEASSEEDP
jgi:predicted RND superfamily exporter protein